MRRSAAPSVSRRQAGVLSEINKEKGSVLSQFHVHKSTVACRSTPNSSATKSETLDSNKRFEIVYAKRSSKKHKKWEEDGILSIFGNQVKIVSTEGKTVSSDTLTVAVLNTIEPGVILSVGSYECQLISILDESQELRKPEFVESSQNKSASAWKPLKKNNTYRILKPDKDAFLLPYPPNNHIWKHNKEGLPITDVFLSGDLATRLHPYQLKGIQFLYECVLGYRRSEHCENFNQDFINDICDEDQDLYGGVLADEMGLGKTVQVIGLISVLLKQGPYGGRPVIRRCLIVTPGSLVMNWQKEFTKWVKRESISTYCVNQDNPLRAYLSQMKPPPVVILSYEMLLQHADRVAEMTSFDLIVCDEGHRLKNLEIKTTAVLKHLPARRRIILTGTPIQNDLNELWSIAEFVAPGCLASSREEYRACIVNPLSKFSHSMEFFSTFVTPGMGMPIEMDSVSADIIEAVQRLKTALNVFLLRRTSDVISRRLPDKVDQIVFCEMSPLQRELERILLKWVRNKLDCNGGDELGLIDVTEEDMHELVTRDKGVEMLACIMAFRKLYNHPSLLLETLEKYSKRDFELAPDKEVLPRVLADTLLRILRRDLPTNKHLDCSSSCLPSGKLVVLHRFLTAVSQLPSDPVTMGGSHRVVLVSNFTQTLDLLEPICRTATMSPCLRIDGKIPTKQRIKIVDQFNSPTCVEKVLLLSSKAGGTGLNLIGADFLVLFDIDWNPATDAQALSRVWREGQKRRVHLIRLLTADSLEERILQRQIAKSSLAIAAMSSGISPISASLRLCELRELFQASPSNSACWTHDLLDCHCQNEPGASKSNFEREDCLCDEEDIRAFQLGRREKRAKMEEETSVSAGGLGQIKYWNHFLTAETVAKATPLMAPSQRVRAVFQHVTTVPD